MKLFSLIRKYAMYCYREDNRRDSDFFGWFAFVIWPIMFSVICVITNGLLFNLEPGVIAASSIVSALITFVVVFLSFGVLEIKEMKYHPQCFLSNWLLIALADIALLPFIGALWFLKEFKNHTGILFDVSKRKLSFVSIKDFANGKFKKNRIQPYLFGRRKPVWNEKTILEIACEIVRDQIGRSLKDEDESDARIVQEIIMIEEIKINKENKSAQLCFSVTLCTRDGVDDKIEAGYYFVSLALDERFNAVDVSNLFFDSKRGQKTKHEIRRAFDLYRANTSDDFGLGYDPLGLNDREELLAQSDFSPDPTIVPVANTRVAE